MGEQALAAGLIDAATASRFQAGKAGPEVVAVVKTALSRNRGAPTPPSEPRLAATSRSTWSWRTSSAYWPSACWSCGAAGHHQAECPLAQRWACAFCQMGNSGKSQRCTACLREPLVQEAVVKDNSAEDPSAGTQLGFGSGAEPINQVQGQSSSAGPESAGSSGNMSPLSQVTALLTVLTAGKGMAREEAEEIIKECGFPLPPPVPLPVHRRDDISALKERTFALERRKKIHSGLVSDLAGLQAKVQHSALALGVLEEDIRQLRFVVSQDPEAPQPAGVTMPEAKEIQSVIANVRTAMLHQDLDCHYESYVAGEKAANRDPLGQFGWLRLVTANELAGCERALEAIQAKTDESERPRKRAARLDAEATA